MNKEQKPPGIARRRFRPYPQYKDSGVEWLGKIPEHWEVKRIKNIARLHTGGTPPGLLDEAFEEEGIPWVKPEQLQGDCGIAPPDRKLSYNAAKSLGIAIEGSALVCGIGTVGKTGHAPFEVCTNQQINSITFGSKVIIRYGQFAAVCLEREFARRSNKVTIAICNKSAMGEAPICIPLAKEQFSIATFLDRETAKIDALIEKRERLIKLLQEKRSILITQTVTKGLDPAIPMKDSGVEWLGKIPAHWIIIPLKHITIARPGSVKTGPFGSQLLASDMAQGEIKVYNQRNVIANDFAGGENYISMSKFRELAAFEVFENDILVTTRGTIGKCAIVPNGAERGILHPCILRIQPDTKKIKNNYLALIIQESNLIIRQLALASNATTIDVIYSETMRRILLPCPPLNEQSAIFEFLDRETAKIDALVTKIRDAVASLKEYRTALISAAVTGKIDVRAAS